MRNDGGQAFPQPLTVAPSGDLHAAYPGMSLRDWFAGKALSLLLDIESKDFSSFIHITDQRRAERAYAIADAMIAEREKPHE